MVKKKGEGDIRVNGKEDEIIYYLMPYGINLEVLPWIWLNENLWNYFGNMKKSIKIYMCDQFGLGWFDISF